jgi:type 1 glutamine amidotransferase
MIRRAIVWALLWAAAGLAAQDPVRVRAFYSKNVESDHVEFAEQAIQFFTGVAQKDHFEFAATTDWDELGSGRLGSYKLILWLNDFPHTQAQRDGFQRYMKQGGAWLGFHVAAYNDNDTHWPWFVEFLGGAVFYSNNWPPLPAELDVDDAASAVTKRLPSRFVSPANEWYVWKPSPRLSKNVKVLVTLDAGNYPLGFKDVIVSGDLPVVWSNTNYKMIYMNMGHGDKVFTSEIQNRLFEDAVLFLTKGK